MVLSRLILDAADRIVQTPSQLIETYQYGPDVAPIAHHEDESVPVWARMFYGPQTWPDQSALPEFRGAMQSGKKSSLHTRRCLENPEKKKERSEKVRYEKEHKRF